MRLFTNPGKVQTVYISRDKEEVKGLGSLPIDNQVVNGCNLQQQYNHQRKKYFPQENPNSAKLRGISDGNSNTRCPLIQPVFDLHHQMSSIINGADVVNIQAQRESPRRLASVKSQSCRRRRASSSCIVFTICATEALSSMHNSHLIYSISRQ